MDNDKNVCEHNTAKAVKEETRKSYDEIKRLREEAERALFDARKQIDSINKYYKSRAIADKSLPIKMASAEAGFVDSYASYAKHYVNLLEFEEFLKFVLSTSIFEDGKIGYGINDHIKFVIELERS